jgi:hypothetical protein
MSTTVEVTLITDDGATNYEPLVFKYAWQARWWQAKLFYKVFGMPWHWPRKVDEF